MEEETVGHALPRGARLGEYDILETLGVGGFGITYRARDRSLDRDVVIKENLPSMYAHRNSTTAEVSAISKTGEPAVIFEWSLKNFVEEAKMLARFDHPNLVKVHRVFSRNGTAYFVMPFLGGKSLSDVIADRQKQDRPFSESELRVLIESLMSGLECIHEAGVFHRDIKPANILMVDEETPVLIDFGSARQHLSEKSMTVFESAGYTPFEQLQREGAAGPWADIYALASTIYKAMTFETPQRSIDRVLLDPMEDRFVELRKNGAYTPEFVEAIEKGMSVDEGDRPQSVAEWRLLFGGEPEKANDPDDDPPTQFAQTAETTKPSIFARCLDLSVWGDKKLLALLVGGLIGLVTLALVCYVIFFGPEEETELVTGGASVLQAESPANSLEGQTSPNPEFGTQDPNLEKPDLQESEPKAGDDDQLLPDADIQVAEQEKPVAAVPLQPFILSLPPFRESLAAAENKQRSFPQISLVSRTNHQHKDWSRQSERLRQTFTVPNPFRNEGGNLPKTIPAKFNGLLAVAAYFDAEAGYVIYGENFGDGSILAIWDQGFTKLIKLFDFRSFRTAPKAVDDERYLNQALRFAALRNGILYVSNFHKTYAKSSAGLNGYISAIDFESGGLIWRSKPLVCNSDNFVIKEDGIITGYGFTDEADFLFILDKHTGETVTSHKVDSGPDWLFLDKGALYVRTYSSDYVFRTK